MLTSLVFQQCQNVFNTSKAFERSALDRDAGKQKGFLLECSTAVVECKKPFHSTIKRHFCKFSDGSLRRLETLARNTKSQ